MPLPTHLPLAISSLNSARIRSFRAAHVASEPASAALSPSVVAWFKAAAAAVRLSRARRAARRDATSVTFAPRFCTKAEGLMWGESGN